MKAPGEGGAADHRPVTVPRVQELGGVFLLDTQHMGYHGTVGVFVLPGPGGTFALIESGPGSTLETVLTGIREAGFEPEKLAAVLVTHIHLDHAGAAGALARRFDAEVYVHENGAGHLLEPERLLASAARIYGDQMEALWGVMEGTPQGLLRPVRDGEPLEILGHRLDVLYTPGHASHHVSYLLDKALLFTGDAAGVRLPGSSVVRPALPPPEVDLESWSRSIQAMRQLHPQALLLTHFGRVDDPEAHFRELEHWHQVWSESVLEGMRAGEDDAALAARINRLSRDALAADGASADTIERHRVTSNDEMTVMGLKRYWQKKHPERLS
ncbi:MBL fold metallo-hydrolase [Truepera radiovictrix]|uniref:Beta-lactamase-like protein n=1 Tax=Truepera radiovictrix (strain DSM 17093 / CIP 108686 / LMG 22925 / RQ-24) TaxID=649638 RepID=D7CQ67_TRURR|nr:MBL fold metallo-hydrolase [Truepera radiovictrix]ADI14851.1 beta-lactamase-like protein [Truepera radiovictrix DSM 17093]WMT56598.1 MBL fold metallo-hydrolase [Truepera radiovictrix]